MNTLLHSVQHLRFHFSLFLLPVFLFALAMTNAPFHGETLLLFILLHFVIYPSSNAYNSIQDRDEGSIGGLKNPPPIPDSLSLVTLIMDIVALTLAWAFINVTVFAFLLLYILASRAYSFRGIRLKQYPIVGYLVVVTLQGGLVFIVTSLTADGVALSNLSTNQWLGALAATVMIGGGYPITQIYQHEQDRQDGVHTMSMLLGIQGTLLYASSLFGLLTAMMVFLWWSQPIVPVLFAAITSPTLLFFIYWMKRVWMNNSAANYDNTMKMNYISTATLNVFFITLLLITHA